MLKRSVLTLVVLACFSAAFADVPSRPATPQELAAITRVVNAVDKVFATFADANWQQKSAYEHPEFDVAKDADRPINFAMQADRQFDIKPGSKLFNDKVAPIAAELQTTTDPGKLMALGKELDGKMSFSVDAEANVFVVGDDKADFSALPGVKGASLSYCNRGAQLDCYLVFGEPARWKPKAGGARAFAWAHPKGYPAVENVIVHFHAKSPTGMAADRVRQLIRSTDWTPIESSLTR